MNQPVINWDDGTITRSVQKPIIYHREPDRIVEDNHKILHKRGRPRNLDKIHNKHNTLRSYCRVCDKMYFRRYMSIHESRPCHLNRVKNL